MDLEPLRALPRLPAVRGDADGIQRQVHGQRPRAPRRLLRHPRQPHPGELPQLLGRGHPLPALRYPAGQGRVRFPSSPRPSSPSLPPDLTGEEGENPYGVVLDGRFPSPGEGGWEGTGEEAGVRVFSISTTFSCFPAWACLISGIPCGPLRSITLGSSARKARTISILPVAAAQKTSMRAPRESRNSAIGTFPMCEAPPRAVSQSPPPQSQAALIRVGC